MEEEATAEQLAAVNARLEMDVVPYADFAIFRPYGCRLLRNLRFVSQVFDPATGTYSKRELPGPPTIVEWRRSYKVWRYAMMVLGAASAPVLDRYAERVERVYRDWGVMGGEDLWWVTLLADVKMRGEGFEQVRRALETKRAELKRMGRVEEAALDPAKPWEAVIYHAASDQAWWDKEIQQTGILYKASLKPKGAFTDEGHHVALGRSSLLLSLGSGAAPEWPKGPSPGGWVGVG